MDIVVATRSTRQILRFPPPIVVNTSSLAFGRGQCPFHTQNAVNNTPLKGLRTSTRFLWLIDRSLISDIRSRWLRCCWMDSASDACWTKLRVRWVVACICFDASHVMERAADRRRTCRWCWTKDMPSATPSATSRSCLGSERLDALRTRISSPGIFLAVGGSSLCVLRLTACARPRSPTF